MILSLSNIFWIGSALTLLLFSFFFPPTAIPYTGGLNYILFLTLYWALARKQKKSTLSASSYWLGVFILLFSAPLFENDQYRYLWESKALFQGFNIYTLAPDQIQTVNFPQKDLVAYSHLSAIYPPLTYLWLFLPSLFPFEWGLRLLMLMNASVVFLFFKRFSHSPLLILLFPYLQKEFIQGVHFDIVPAFLLFLAYEAFFHQKSYWKFSIFLALSSGLKLLSLVAAPFFFLWLKQRESLKKALTYSLPTLVLAMITYLVLNQEGASGGKAFSQTWVWHPGFYRILTHLLELSPLTARLVSLSFFLSFLFSLIFSFKRFHPQVVLYLVLSSMMFFSPVFNPWYAIWFLPFALKSSLSYGVLYAYWSGLSYIYYGHPEWINWGMLINHSLFLLSLREAYLKAYR